MKIEYESPLTKKKYTIFEPSPMMLAMMYDSENAESSTLRLQIQQVTADIEVNNEVLKRPGLHESEREMITRHTEDKQKELDMLRARLISVTKIKKSTLCEIVRTFVTGFENMQDIEMIRETGKDLDLLFLTIQELADKDSNTYNEAMSKATKFFRVKAETGGGTGSAGT